MKATLITPDAVRLLVITGADKLPAGLRVITSMALPDPAALLALMTIFTTPVMTGVPDISPVVVFTVKPAGRPVALKPVGDWVPVIW